jgi:acetate kinase
MKSEPRCVLAINGGSSSIRFVLYEGGGTLRRRLGGKIDRIGLGGTQMTVDDRRGQV